MLETGADAVDEADGRVTVALRAGSGHALGGSASAEVVVKNAAPVSAVFENVPASHDGATPFRVQMRFSEEVVVSDEAFAAGLLSVSGGSVESARRLTPPSSVGWDITVRPAGAAEVAITLPAAAPCGTAVAVCTSDGRRLAASASATVAGPRQLRVGGSTLFEVLEGETAVATLAATGTDTPAANLDWSIADGADSAHFAILEDAALAFAGPKDFENPDDADADGSYQVTVQASDGASNARADLTVALADRNEAPTANAGADQENIAEGATVTLAGTAIDPDADDTLTYAWSQTGGPVVTLSDAAVAAPTFLAPTGLAADTTLSFTLAVTDRAGLNHEDAVSVTVKASPPPVATITAGASPVSEGTAATFTVSLDARAARALAVAVSVAETGAVLAGTPLASVAFAKGAASATVTVPTAADSVVEADSTITVTVTAGPGYAVGTEASASVTVEDDDDAIFTVSADAEAIDEGESTTLTIGISNAVTFSEAQIITLATSGTASSLDHSGVPPTLELAPGVSEATATLAAATDDEEEEAETVTVTASHDGAEIGSATVTIHSISHDATLASLSLSGVDIGTFSGAVTSYEASVAHSVTATTVTATASHTGATVTVEPGPEVGLAVGGNEVAITVTAEDGTTAKTYTVTVTRAALPVARIAAGATPVTEGAAATFTVSLDQVAPEALTVAVDVTESGSVLSGTPPASVAFAKGAASATLTAPTSGNSVVEPDSTVTASVRGGNGYTVDPAATASVIVENDDAATFTVSAEPATIREGESATLTVEIANGVTFAEQQTLALSTSGTAAASDYTGVSAALTLAAGASSASLTLAAAADGEEEDAETLTVTASHGGSEVGSASVTIHSVSARRDADRAEPVGQSTSGRSRAAVTAYAAKRGARGGDDRR